MAVVQNPIIGRARGKFGNAVFTTQFGKNVLKTKPLTVADAQSDSQVERRNAITQIVAIFRAISTATKQGFKSLAVGMSAYNAFSSYNLKEAFTYSGTTPATLVPASLLISKGTIEKVVIATLVGTDSSADVVFTFPTTVVGAGQSATDLAIIVVWNATLDIWEGEISSAARSTGTATLTMSQAVSTGDVLHGYLGFTNISGSAQSDSDYETDTP